MRKRSQVIFTGDVVGSFEVLGLPSENTFDTMHHFKKASITKHFRELAYDRGLDIVGWNDTPLVQRAFVLISVWVPHEGIMDIHNVRIKPVMDGLTDAGVFVDDEWAFVPAVANLWAGVGTELLETKGRKKKRRVRARRTIFTIFDLESVKVSGLYQRLPKGRRRL